MRTKSADTRVTCCRHRQLNNLPRKLQIAVWEFERSHADILAQWDGNVALLPQADLIAAGGDLSLSRAPEITCPLLLMLGDNDKLNPVEDGRRFVDTVSSKDKTFEVFENTRHAIQDEQPERFLSLVRGFLKRNAS